MKIALPLIAFAGAAFAVTGNAQAQSALEAATFILSGQEINAPGKEWSGTLKNLSSEYKHSAKQISGCVFEFSGPSAVSIVDFSKIVEIDLKPMNVFDMSVAQESKVINSPNSICNTWPSGEKKCSSNEPEMVPGLSNVHVRGNVSKDPDLYQSAVQLSQRKQKAYEYFRATYCKPKAY